MTRLLFSLVALLIAPACQSQPSKPATPSPAVAPPAAAKPAPVEPTGLAAKGNNPEIVALAAEALKCAHDGSHLFDFKCDAFKGFLRAKAIADQDATLVSFWEDADPRVRLLGAFALPDGINDHPPFRNDPALSQRMVRALAKETESSVASAMARRVARIDVETTGLLAPIAELIKSSRHPGATEELINNLLFTNSRSRATYDYFLTLTQDPDKGVRRKAVDAFWIGGGLSAVETCKMWEAHLDDAAPEVAGAAAYHLGMSNDCRAHDAVLLGRVGDRLKAKTTGGESHFASSLAELCGDENASVANKLAAARLAKEMAADKELEDFLRWRGLEAVTACDKKGGRGFVARLTHDKNKFVAEKARETLKRR
jgi:hypothetical protein